VTPASEVLDVILVGFGPTGATLANLLGRQGVRTLVIERAPEVYTAFGVISGERDADALLRVLAASVGS
jgi:3-(3-hydroxy-phenyl)propionate hydroxylase